MCNKESIQISKEGPNEIWDMNGCVLIECVKIECVCNENRIQICVINGVCDMIMHVILRYVSDPLPGWLTVLPTD